MPARIGVCSAQLGLHVAFEHPVDKTSFRVAIVLAQTLPTPMHDKASFRAASGVEHVANVQREGLG